MRSSWRGVGANFKETELTHMRKEQEVTAVAEAYPDARWGGRRVPVSVRLDSSPDGAGHVRTLAALR